jgi:DNA-binding GntR family transcriptional regulator
MTDILSDHGVVEPGRGKGTRVNRLGRKENISKLIVGQQTSPNDDALQHLRRLLKDANLVPADVREQYIGLYENSDKLRHMNRPLLAETITLMYQTNITVDTTTGTTTGLEVLQDANVMRTYIERIMSKPDTPEQKAKISDTQRQIMVVKTKDSIFGYLRNIIILIITNSNRAYAAATSSNAVVAAPAIDEQLDLAPLLP